jgi:hypothetical protein
MKKMTCKKSLIWTCEEKKLKQIFNMKNIEKLKCVCLSLEDKNNVQFDDMKRKIWKAYNMELPYI